MCALISKIVSCMRASNSYILSRRLARPVPGLDARLLSIDTKQAYTCSLGSISNSARRPKRAKAVYTHGNTQNDRHTLNRPVHLHTGTHSKVTASKHAPEFSCSASLRLAISGERVRSRGRTFSRSISANNCGAWVVSFGQITVRTKVKAGVVRGLVVGCDCG